MKYQCLKNICSWWLCSMIALVSLNTAALAAEVPADTTADSELLSPEQIRADFKQLYRSLKRAHYDLFANISAADYTAAYEDYLEQFTQPLSRDQVNLRFQQFMALGKVAHAKIDLPMHAFQAFREQGGKAFPLYIKVVDEQIFVSENYSTETIPLGAQLISIDGVAVGEYLARLKRYLSADTEIMANGFLEFYLPMLIWFEYGAQEHFSVTYQSGEAKRVTRKVAAMSRTAMQALETSGPERLELGMEREFRMLDGQVGYLRPGPFFNTDPNAKDLWDTTNFKVFIDSAMQSFGENQAQALLIDLRNNPGGSNSFSDYMLQQIAHKPFQFAAQFSVKVSPESIAANAKRLANAAQTKDSFSQKIAAEYAARKTGDVFAYSIETVEPLSSGRFTKPVYVLTNRHSYSNAVFVAAIVQDYGFGTIIGEETADLATTYGAMEHFKLEHSKLTVGYPKALIIRPSGDNTVRGVVPDIAIATPLIETRDDPVLQYTLSHILAAKQKFDDQHKTL